MPAKDKKYRKAKKWLVNLQEDLDGYNKLVIGELASCVRSLFEDTHSGMWMYGVREFAKKYGRKHNPQDYVDREKRKKYRTPIRRRR